jgi:hypothetical protein
VYLVREENSNVDREFIAWQGICSMIRSMGDVDGKLSS